MSANTFKNVASSTTDSVVIPASPGRAIRVFGLAVQCGGTATEVQFNTTGTSSIPISMNVSLAANGAFLLPQPANSTSRTVWFQTNPGESLTVTTSAGSTVGIQVVYDLFITLQTISVVVTPPVGFDDYVVSNDTPTYSYDASLTSLDEIANVLGTLIELFKTGTTITSAFTVTNVSTDRSFSATSTSLDELANVIGTLIADLSSTGTSSQSYIPTNVSTDTTLDCLSTSMEEVANVLGSVIATLQGDGKLL